MNYLISTDCRLQELFVIALISTYDVIPYVIPGRPEIPGITFVHSRE